MAPPPPVKAAVLSLKSQGDKAYAGRDFAAAIERYSEALEIAEDAVVLSNRSATYAQRRRFDKALADAERALQLSPDWTRLHHRKGHALFDLCRYGEAIEAFEAGLALDPQDSSLLEAAARAASYTEPDPDAPAPRRAAARPQRRSGGAFSSGLGAGGPAPAAAAPAAKVADDEAAPAASAEELREKGNQFFREGKHSKALRMYDEAIRADPQDPKAFSNRAAAQMAMLAEFGKGMPKEKLRGNPYYDNAMSDLTQALALDPSYVKAWARKGELHLRVGEVRQAQAAYLKGLHLNPTSADCKAGSLACERANASAAAHAA